MKAYLAYCRRGVEFFRPDYLAIGIEVNEVFQAGPDKWRAYVRLHRHVYEQLRKEHPKLPIFASFTLHGMLNLRGDARAKMLAALQEIMPQNDVVGVSFYPFIAGGTTDIAGALAWLTRSFDAYGKPYAFVETGEAAQKLTFPSSGQVLAGTSEKQAAYYRALLAFAQSRRAEFVISFLYRDYDALWDKIRASSPEAFMAWRDCGLLDEAGMARPAYEIWKQYYTMPLAPR
jgi:arabinogalactan endo-1,4-beta-galactosidase